MMDAIRITSNSIISLKLILFLAVISVTCFMGLPIEMFYYSLFFLVISVLIRGYALGYEITKVGNIQKLILYFGWCIRKVDIDFGFPDYVSVFHASHIDRDEIEGTVERFKVWVVRFFSGSTYLTVFEDDEYTVALQKAKELANFLKIDLYDTSKT